MEAKPELTLRDAGQLCMQFNKLQEDSLLIQGDIAVKSVKQQAKKPARSPKPQPQPQQRKKKGQRGASGSTSTEPGGAKPPGPCWHCGDEGHFNANCPFKANKCRVCSAVGHKDGHCEKRKSKSQSKTVKQITVRWIDAEPEAERNYAEVVIHDVKVTLQVDTGSDATIIAHEDWKKMGRPTLTPCSNATAVNGSSLRLYGRFRTKFYCTLTPRSGSGMCYVSDDVRVMGRSWLNQAVPEQLQDLKLICASIAQPKADATSTITELQAEFPDVFRPGLGRCTKTKAVLQLEPNASPVFRRSRPVPHAAVADVEDELDRLVDMGVLSSTNYSDWAAPIVVVKKSNGRIRLCADYSTGLNDSLKLHQYPLPVPEDIFSTLNGGRYFSLIDFSEAYLQIEVADESKDLLTIATHRGLYRFNRLPFGVKSAPGIFQQIVNAMLADVKGATAYLDDVIVVGKDIADHRKNLRETFRRIADYGFRVQLDKCSFFKHEIKYLGFVVDAQGRRPDPAKIAAIVNMPNPTDLATLRSFLGMLSYYGNFVDKMRHIRAPLDELLKKDAEWVWTPERQEAVDRAKQVLQSDLLLTHFDPNVDMVVAGDASNYGIGAVILHRFRDGSEKAIAYASRSLTSAERNYAQIEKEGLALVFAVKKFHKFLHGRRFLLQTDHKPLLTIFGCRQGIPVYTANRLQRWATTLLGYDFAIEHQRTADFGQADALSRLIATYPRVEEEEIVIATSKLATPEKASDDERLIGEHPIVSSDLPLHYKTIQQETANDAVLTAVVKAVKSGRWPTADRLPSLSAFQKQKDKLLVTDGCLLLGDRVVVPENLQTAVLTRLHAGHPGIVRMKKLARRHVYWPKIDAAIERTVKECKQCATTAKNPTKTTLQSWPKPEAPWERVHADYAGPMNGRYYLVIVDAGTKWMEIAESTTMTADITIDNLNRIFSSYGFPKVLVTDNGTQFTSRKFAAFCMRNGIDHVRSPPFHPQSNGQAERFIDTFKRGMAKLRGEGSPANTLQQFLLAYRSTPSRAVPGEKSPAEAFLGRPLRTTLDLLNPTKEARQGPRDAAMEAQFNRHHGARKHHFSVGDAVNARDYRVPSEPGWAAGTITRRTGRVTFLVDVNGTPQVRHANQLRARIQPRTDQDSFDSTPSPIDDSRTAPQVPTDASPPPDDCPTSGPIQPQ
uniref:RNA-directed DNA polymerase n=1 Tax=Plectus sambesii TaxID=2011161 RepID=A0A914WIF7_9BILA